MLLGDLRQGSILSLTKPYVRLILSAMWRNRSLLGLITAELVSLTGSSMTFVALPFFVYLTTGSTAKMGWVLAAEMLPIAIFGIPAGTVIAKLGARRRCSSPTRRAAR